MIQTRHLLSLIAQVSRDPCRRESGHCGLDPGDHAREPSKRASHFHAPVSKENKMQKTFATAVALALLGQPSNAEGDKSAVGHPYVGMWVTDDNLVRHELLPDGRYDEARGTRESAYQGRYEVEGNYIQYWDDTGFTADGTFIDESTLHHGGMILRRRQ